MNSEKILDALNVVKSYVKANEIGMTGSTSMDYFANLMDMILEWPHMDMDSKLEQVRLNAHIIGKYPQFFNRQFQMMGPTGLIHYKGNNYTVSAKEVTFSVNTTLEKLQDTYAISKKDYKNMWEIVYTQVADEFAEKIQKILDEGNVFCPYWPMVMIKSTDPNTFQPTINFKSRYGIINPNK